MSKKERPRKLSGKELDRILQEAAQPQPFEDTPDRDKRIREIFFQKVTEGTKEQTS